MMRPKSSGRSMRASICTTRSCSSERTAPTGRVLVLVAHRVDHLVGADAEGLHGLRVQVDVDLALGAAHQRDRADAAHVFQPLLEHLVGPVGELDRAERAGRAAVARLRVRQHGHRPDGAAGRVEAQHARVFHLVAKQRAHGGDLFAHVFGRLAPVDVQLELDDDDRLAFVAARGQGVDAGDRVDAFLDLLGDFALDDLGRCAGYSVMTTTTGKSMFGNWSTCSRW